MQAVRPASGHTACLIKLVTGEYKIRIYEPVTDIPDTLFKDYSIRHSDLFFVISDIDAYLYECGNDMWIDHSPRTLGIKE